MNRFFPTPLMETTFLQLLWPAHFRSSQKPHTHDLANVDDQEWLPSLCCSDWRILWPLQNPPLSLPRCNCVKRQPGHSEGLRSNTKRRAGWWWWRDERRKIRRIVPSEGPWMIYNTNWRLHERLGKLICTSLPRSLRRSLARSAQPHRLLSSGVRKKEFGSCCSI